MSVLAMTNLKMIAVTFLLKSQFVPAVFWFTHTCWFCVVIEKCYFWKRSFIEKRSFIVPAVYWYYVPDFVIFTSWFYCWLVEKKSLSFRLSYLLLIGFMFPILSYSQVGIAVDPLKRKVYHKVIAPAVYWYYVPDFVIFTSWFYCWSIKVVWQLQW